MSKTIIVSNRLPVSIKREGDTLKYKSSAGGLATGLGSIYKNGDNIWMGWPGLYSDDETEKKEIIDGLKKESMRPVFLNKKLFKNFYEGYSNSTIWPQFHYFSQYTEYNLAYWNAYVEVNQIFCDEVLKVAKDGDIIWVHDYQLMLLPEMLRKELPNASIGYFHHIPFPSYEVFRMLPHREHLLKGLLGADMIGYHTYDDMRHFLSAISRILGYEHEMGYLKSKNRIIRVDALPMGIDYEKFEKAAISKDTQREIKSFLGSLQTDKLILSIDRLDYSKGIPQRLKAFDQLLSEHPELKGKVSLILLVVPSRDTVDHYIELKEEIELLVGRINGKYSQLEWTPIHFFYRALPFSKLSALYSMSDIALVTPLRDGMNLVCKEFIASKLDKTGVLILSEMAGSAKELSEALLINPNDRGAIVNAMYQALNMSDDEQVRRNTDMQEKLKRYNIHAWVDRFMTELKQIKEEQKELMAKKLNKKTQAEIVEKYKSTKKRLILLDYDGTLTPFHKDPKAAKPDQELHSLFEKLTADPANQIVVISGRDRASLQDWLGSYDIEFIAEHGVWLKERGEGWHMIDELPIDWKEEIRPILELYVDRTPGSLIEEKDYSLVWHFRKTEAGFGELRARELISNLQYLTLNMDIQIMEGNKVIEVKNSGVNKGRAAMKWINNEKWDFIFAVGDDTTDEDTFKVLPTDAYSLKVGEISSEARYNISDVAAVRSLLTEFTDK